MPSITNIKKIKAIDALPGWAAKQCGLYVKDKREILSNPALSDDDVFKLVKGAPWAKDGDKENSSRVGDVVHEWTDRFIKGGTIADEEFAHPFYFDRDGKQIFLAQGPARTAFNMWRQFLHMVDTYHPKWIMSEFTVWSDRYGYAGTGDWIADINGRITLVDSKTGNRTYDDTAMQLAAIAFADFILEQDGSQIPIPDITHFAAYHMRPRFSRLVPYRNDAVKESFTEFLALLVVFNHELKWHQYDRSQPSKVQLFAPKLEAPPIRAKG